MANRKRAKPRGLYYADDDTRKRVASAGGFARAKMLKNKKKEN